MLRKFIYLFFLYATIASVTGCESSSQQKKTQLTFASFNVSMESENYLGRYAEGVSNQVLIDELASGENKQIQNIAKIIQTIRPDVLLLNEFDYIENSKQGIEQFISAYLNVPQGETQPIDYPYFYYSTFNTGVATPFDLNGDGKFEGTANDAYGYGRYPGHYGMVLISTYPIEEDKVRTFQYFKWKDMPNYLETTTADEQDFYTKEAWDEFRLSSKSHWDVPIQVGKQTIHVLASHPTPSGFDGEEDRNGKRNHDEIRFWTDYIDSNNANYIYDDEGKKGGLGENSFVVMGDLNASPDGGGAIKSGIINLLHHPKVNNSFTPSSKGAENHSPQDSLAKYHTAIWRSRADYVLPSFDLRVKDYGVFWPKEGEGLHELMLERKASSDHRLVWVKIEL